MASADFLDRMAAASRERAAAAEAAVPSAELARAVQDVPPPAALQLSAEGFDLIAEVKRRSPALGELAGSSLDPAAQAGAYVAGGAAALSVLTEPTEFHGELAHLAEVAAAVGPVPAMRKDFLVSPYQVLEARRAGAGGVLLIAAMLDAPTLAAMLQTTRELGMFALVEVFDREDLARCLPVLAAAGPARDGDRAQLLLGVNCRDLRSLQVDFGRFAELAGELPADLPHVAESGVDGPAQAAEVAALGYQLALVGTALMRAPDPAAMAQALLAAGRAA